MSTRITTNDDATDEAARTMRASGVCCPYIAAIEMKCNHRAAQSCAHAISEISHRRSTHQPPAPEPASRKTHLRVVTHAEDRIQEHRGPLARPAVHHVIQQGLAAATTAISAMACMNSTHDVSRVRRHTMVSCSVQSGCE